MPLSTRKNKNNFVIRAVALKTFNHFACLDRNVQASFVSIMNAITQIHADQSGERGQLLTPEALFFLSALHEQFEGERLSLLERRRLKAAAIQNGLIPSLNPETTWIRLADWQVPKAPPDLNDRRVEITGPTDAKMMINALNSGAKVFMADLEDSTAPTWENIIDGQVNLRRAVERTLQFTSPEGKEYKLKPDLATLVVRPRGWHMQEAHVTFNGRAISASLFDFGLFFFHNARNLCARGSAPYFYLPKLESHLEARLWNQMFLFSQKYMGLPAGTIRATVLIETCLAAFEMDEILYELREHAAGLNAGRWDYLFSMIKKFSHREDLIFPDRSDLTMTVPFMRAYTETLVEICHRRGAHAIGGMAAFIPSRKDPKVNENALLKVREDKTREANDGFDGTWVAHPDLVPVAQEIFDAKLGPAANQKHVRKSTPAPDNLLPTPVPGGKITKAGVINNISVSLQYLRAWLNGSGAVGIFNLMEDAATAEIARAELWQWVRRQVRTQEGDLIEPDSYALWVRDCVQELGGMGLPRMKEAVALLNHLVLSEEFTEFLTLPAYELIVNLKPAFVTTKNLEGNSL